MPKPTYAEFIQKLIDFKEASVYDFNKHLVLRINDIEDLDEQVTTRRYNTTEYRFHIKEDAENKMALWCAKSGIKLMNENLYNRLEYGFGCFKQGEFRSYSFVIITTSDFNF